VLSERLQSILVCPEDRGPLLLIVDERLREEHGPDERLREEHGSDERLREEHGSDERLREEHGSDERLREGLYNPRLRRFYRIEDGIPVLLVDDAVTITDDAEHERLLERAKA
jgi:uncharacterized protein